MIIVELNYENAIGLLYKLCYQLSVYDDDGTFTTFKLLNTADILIIYTEHYRIYIDIYAFNAMAKYISDNNPNFNINISYKY